MSWLSNLFNKTLQPTDAEIWRSAHDDMLNDYLDLAQENNRLEAHIDFNRDLFAEIHAQGVNSTSGTAQSMAAKAKAGCGK